MKKQFINAEQPICLINYHGIPEVFTFRDMTRRSTLPDEFDKPFRCWKDARDWVLCAVAYGDWKPIGNFAFLSNHNNDFNKRDKVIEKVFFDDDELRQYWDEEDIFGNERKYIKG